MLRDLRPKSKDAPHRIPTEHKTCRSSQSRVWDCARRDGADVGRKPKSIGPGVRGDKLDTHLRRTSLLSNKSLQVSAAIDLDPEIARGGTARPVHPKEQAESVRPDALVDEEGIPISPCDRRMKLQEPCTAVRAGKCQHDDAPVSGTKRVTRGKNRRMEQRSLAYDSPLPLTLPTPSGRREPARAGILSGGTKGFPSLSNPLIPLRPTLCRP